jgi:hypothetical protein
VNLFVLPGKNSFVRKGTGNDVREKFYYGEQLMKFNRTLKFVIAILSVTWAGTTAIGSDDLEYCNERSPDGVLLDAERKRVVSVYRQPIVIPDASGVRKARVIAQERAKGEMVRFFDQSQSTIRTVASEDSSAGTSTRTTGPGGETVTSQFTREQTEVLREIETSYASGDLSGVIQVEEAINENVDEVCVAMGFSAKSAAGAREAQGWMQESRDIENGNDKSKIEDYSGRKRKREGAW